MKQKQWKYRGIYVIVFMLAVAGFPFMPEREVSAAGENLAYQKEVTVTSVESSSYPGSNAVDADGNTRWSSAYYDNQNFIVDLGQNYLVNQVRIAWEAAYASQYQIQVSVDGENWSTVYSDYNAPGGIHTVSFDKVTARYVKLYAIKRATVYGFSIYEFEVYGDEISSESGASGTDMAGINLAYQMPVTVSSTESSSYAGSNAVDADGNSRWASSYSDYQNFIVDLGQNYPISQVKVAWEAAYASQYQIQVSTDNKSWTTVYSDYEASGGTNVISFSEATARYVKLYAIKRATSYGFSIYEFEVYTSGASGTGGTGSSDQLLTGIAAKKQKVLDYFYSISGKQTVIGINNREPNSQPNKQTNIIHDITGVYPGLWSGDFLYQKSDVSARQTMINECINQWNAGSLVQLMLHVAPPTVSVSAEKNGVGWSGTGTSVMSKLSDSQWNDLITNGGTLNRQWKLRLDEYAGYLQQLKDAGVVVLFRPFHEMNQGGFWWGGRTGSNGTGALYRLTRDYLENEKGLDNIIWVWDMQDLSYNWSDYNPGNNYWDIFAVDFYNGDGFTSYKYQKALEVAGNKPIAIGECDKLPTASELAGQQRWVFCMSWAELTFSYNTNSQIQNLYWAGNVLVRSELPDFN